MEIKSLLLFVVGLCLTEQALTPPSCGQRFLVNTIYRVVGGSEAPGGSWPWQVSVQFNGKHHCSGTILNNLWVLSASHCYIKITPQLRQRYLKVVAGLSKLSYPGRNAQTRHISHIKMHKDYYVSRPYDYDAALLRLSYPLNFNGYVQPACAPDSVTHEALLNFTSCYISGWGSMYYPGPSVDRLREAKVELIYPGKCNQLASYRGIITENMMCAGKDGGRVDTCQGDSGGPLQCYSGVDKRFYVVGVTSFGEKCGHPDMPGVYTRTSRISDWIQKTQVMSGHTTERADIKLASVLLILVLIQP